MSVIEQKPRSMKVLVSANMGPGTLRAKIVPLAGMTEVEQVYILRKKPADSIDKVSYLKLPSLSRFAIFHLILHPIYLAFYARKYKVDFIIGYHFIPYAFFAHLASKLSGKPFIVAQTGLLIQNTSPKGIKGRWLKRITREAKFLFTPGQESRMFWEQWGVSANKIKTLHSTIDTSLFQKAERNQTFDFIFVGRLNPIKQIELILEGFYKVTRNRPELRFLIVGSGPLEMNLKRRVEQLGLESSVKFAGFQADVKPFLDMASFFIMASKSEGLPCAIMEAMSNGNIVLSTMVGNIPDLIVENTTGIPIKQSSADGIEQAMNKALDMDESERTKMINKGRLLIENHHSFLSAQNKWREVFKSLS